MVSSNSKLSLFCHFASSFQALPVCNFFTISSWISFQLLHHLYICIRSSVGIPIGIIVTKSRSRTAFFNFSSTLGQQCMCPPISVPRRNGFWWHGFHLYLYQILPIWLVFDPIPLAMIHNQKRYLIWSFFISCTAWTRQSTARFYQDATDSFDTAWRFRRHLRDRRPLDFVNVEGSGCNMQADPQRAAQHERSQFCREGRVGKDCVN